MALCFGEQAAAGACPDFFRFVDFGQPDVNGLARGGTLIRVESLEGRPLLERVKTECSDAQFLASDGHGNPIPVVTSVTFDAQKLPFGASSFTLRRSEDAFVQAEGSAQTHRDRLTQSSIPKLQGDSHLCVGTPKSLSCQLVSPYLQQAPLVVYCDHGKCTMPALAFNDHIIVGSAWSLDSSDVEAIADEIVRKVQDISAFLETQS